MGPYFFMGGEMWILPIIGIIVILFIIYMMFGHGGFAGGCGHDRHHDRHHAKDHHSESAIDILNKRYAGGKITKEEFEQMKKDISG